MITYPIFIHTSHGSSSVTGLEALIVAFIMFSGICACFYLSEKFDELDVSIGQNITLSMFLAFLFGWIITPVVIITTAISLLKKVQNNN